MPKRQKHKKIYNTHKRIRNKYTKIRITQTKYTNQYKHKKYKKRNKEECETTIQYNNTKNTKNANIHSNRNKHTNKHKHTQTYCCWVFVGVLLCVGSLFMCFAGFCWSLLAFEFVSLFNTCLTIL